MIARPRVIPCLLLRGRGLVKTTKFKDPVYLGDPINIIKIFNDKEVDELIVLDITATIEGRGPAFDYIGEMASECFMPLCYGGGLQSIEDIQHVLSLGVEKVSLNTCAVADPTLIRQAADLFGSQAIVVSIDARKNRLGRYEIFTHGGRKATGLDPVRFAVNAVEMGAGEILLTAIDRDGTMQGYDLDLLKRVCGAVDVPVIACGGAGNLQHMVDAIREGGASAAAAGSMFVFHGRYRAVLISYPSSDELEKAFAPTPSNLKR